MKSLSFLAASVVILSSLAIAAPVDAKRGEDIYTKETLSITGKEKREELYAGLQDTYTAGVLKVIEKDGIGAEEKREELYGGLQDTYTAGALKVIEKKDSVGAEEVPEDIYGAPRYLLKETRQGAEDQE